MTGTIWNSRSVLLPPTRKQSVSPAASDACSMRDLYQRTDGRNSSASRSSRTKEEIKGLTLQNSAKSRELTLIGDELSRSQRPL